MTILGSPLFWLMMFSVVVSSSVSSSAGFGFGILLVAMFQFFMEPVEFVGVITILGCVGSLLRITETRKIGLWKRSLYFIIPGLFGVPLGVALLKYLAPLLMKRYINLVLLASVSLLYYNLKNPFITRFINPSKRKLSAPLIGFISGVLGGSSTLSGPPIVIWGMLQGWNKMEMHAIWARFFFSIALFSLFTLGFNGLYKESTIVLSLYLIPAIFLGFKIGTWIRDKLAEERFRHYVLSFLFLSGLVGLALSFR